MQQTVRQRELARQPLSWFKRASNVRKSHRTEESRRQMWESLKKRQIHPLLALFDGTLIDGYLRLESAELGEITHLDVVMLDEIPSAEEIIDIQFSSAYHRVGLSAWDKYLAGLAIKEAHPSWTAAQVAEFLAIDAGQFSRIMSPEKTVAPVKDAVRDGKITTDACSIISKATTPEIQLALLPAAIKKAGREKLESLRKKLEAELANPTTKPDPDDDPIGKIKIPLATEASTGTVTVSCKGTSWEDFETILKEALKFVRSAKDKPLDPKTAMAMWRDMAAAGA